MTETLETQAATSPDSPGTDGSDASIDRASNTFPPRVTGLLLAWADGDPKALRELMPLVCDELRQMARRYVNHADPVLQPTALVNEFFLRVQGRRTVSWKNRAHFFGFAAQTMRLILVDHARLQHRKKRGSGEAPLSLEPEFEPTFKTEPTVEILAVHEVLDRLDIVDHRAAEVVKLRFFVGMSVSETAAALETSPATVKRDWKFARLWLFQELQGKTPTPENTGPASSESEDTQPNAFEIEDPDATDIE